MKATRNLPDGASAAFVSGPIGPDNPAHDARPTTAAAAKQRMIDPIVASSDPVDRNGTLARRRNKRRAAWQGSTRWAVLQPWA
jgi:hypothetical protein